MERQSRNFSKNRLQPYKLFTLLMYGNYEWAEWQTEDKVVIKTGPAARLMNVTANKLREHIDWLVARGFFTYAASDYGVAILIVRRPPTRAPAAPTVKIASDAEFKAAMDSVMAQPWVQDVMTDLAPRDVHTPIPEKPVDKKKIVW